MVFFFLDRINTLFLLSLCRFINWSFSGIADLVFHFYIFVLFQNAFIWFVFFRLAFFQLAVFVQLQFAVLVDQSIFFHGLAQHVFFLRHFGHERCTVRRSALLEEAQRRVHAHCIVLIKAMLVDTDH